MQNFSATINECIANRISDLYVLPLNEQYKMLYHNVQGVMTTKKISLDTGNQLISYLKYRANMAVSEHRRPQVGALVMEEKGEIINLRLSSVGDYSGKESLVIRFIYSFESISHQQLIPNQLGMLQQLVQHRGLILFSGPMGSGKTTTMYQLARKAMKNRVVMTIEDPVEIEEKNFIQLQVNNQANMSYDQLLKVGLRHRPEAFIIGEIRDTLTAKMAIRAALSGHLVLSTVHAKNVFGVISRMEQLGVEQSYLAQVLTGVCYQRLLPTTQDSIAVLYDLLAGDQLNLAVMDKNNRPNRMTAQWSNYLEEGVKKCEITRTTAKTYQEG